MISNIQLKSEKIEKVVGNKVNEVKRKLLKNGRY